MASTHLSPTRIPGKTSSDILWTLRGILGLPAPKLQSPVTLAPVQSLKTGKMWSQLFLVDLIKLGYKMTFLELS